MMDLILPAFELNLWYSQKLVADVPDEHMCAQPVAGRVLNHAAFVLGHLAWSADDAAAGQLGLPRACPAGWKELFDIGAQPLPDRSLYPSKAELLRALADAHARLADAVTKAPPEVLNRPPAEVFRDRCPTVGALLAVWMTTHEATHNGQLSAWRRAMGLPPAL